jgi:molybdenum cofactor cytidylyltransferase
VIRHVCDAAMDSPVDEVVVVLGHAADEVGAVLSPGDRLRLIRNDDYTQGQSTSLVAGIQAMDARARAAVVLLGDQPEVRSEAIAAVVRTWREEGGRVVQASYTGRAAHPTLFDRSVWADLERTIGDEGARGVLARHPAWRSLVEVGGRPPHDIDTEEDYQRVRASFS